ncbi:myosin tail region-interacting protein MTI1-like [Homarus americanus]|uniref:myosin tail region-interacting protein MTI1-like n=1 Tax=Homarus americanus TaxID=6706 RepID=UPI001C4796CD|nr:myosin tail region-interacting protein MTI1-like [Homarus americanus]
MDKASKAIRRSGVRLRSMSSGHGSLQMVISQLGEVRTSFKAFALAQATASEDLLSWSGGSHENRAIEETFTHLAELSLLWSEVQRDFADHLKEYRTQYELILEGEKHITQAREMLSVREQREGKLRKDLKKACKKAPPEEIHLLREKLSQAERSRDLAHLEVVERVGENEAVKMIRVKEGLLKLGGAYCELAHKCMMIFSAHQNIASQLPDVHDRDLHDIKYTGAGSAKKFVQDAKEQVRSYRRNSISQKLPLPEDPPPPYTPSVEHLDDLSSNSKHNGTNNSSHNMPFNMNTSSFSEPSAPNASISTISSPDRLPRGRGPTVPHKHSTPNAPTIPPPQSPPSHIYPDLPRPPRSQPFHIPNSPSLPEETHPPHLPSPPNSPHSNSEPNLNKESHLNQVVKYPPLSACDNSSFNESTFHPDTSSSSPNLASNRQPTTSTVDESLPYNPYYDWLPATNGEERMNGRCSPENQSISPATGTSKPETKGKVLGSHTAAPSVRPRVNRNPFFDGCSDEEGKGEESLSGAMRKTSIR